MVGFQRHPGEEEGLSRVRGWWLEEGSGESHVYLPAVASRLPLPPRVFFLLGSPAITFKINIY